MTDIWAFLLGSRGATGTEEYLKTYAASTPIHGSRESPTAIQYSCGGAQSLMDSLKTIRVGCYDKCGIHGLTRGLSSTAINIGGGLAGNWIPQICAVCGCRNVYSRGQDAAQTNRGVVHFLGYARLAHSYTPEVGMRTTRKDS